MVDNSEPSAIGKVERETGIGRDTLRVWERRYGFPDPTRNAKGERIYTETQLRRLQRIRRLLNCGLRPGKLVPLSEDELDKLEANLQPKEASEPDKTVNAMLKAIRTADTRKIESLLLQQYQIQGMQRFILDTVIPLLNRVGELWLEGKLQIFQEHFLSEQLIRFLNAEIASIKKAPGKPLVLLATLPGEEHTLGLLIVSAMLSSLEISTINLGGQVPMDQIGQAVEQFKADALGITFSGAYQYSNIHTHLTELRELISDDVDIWIGGEGVRRLRKLPAGVTRFKSLDSLQTLRKISTAPGK